MPTISLRCLLSKLTVLALASSPAATSADSVHAPQTVADEDADLDASLDANLPIDADQVDRHEAVAVLGRTLAHALAELRPLAATHLATSWALSEDPLRRAAIAHALEHAFPLLGDGTILDHLSHDRDAGIRIAVARAARVRRPAGGDLGVLARLAEDADPAVRAVASRATR